MIATEQWKLLHTWLWEHAPLVIACSGGFDSRFLAHATHSAQVPFVLLHHSGGHLPQHETQFVQHWAKQHQFPLHVLHTNPLSQAEVCNNDKLRCYYCKRFLFSHALQFLTEAMEKPYTVCDGSNASDAMFYRPGNRALQELGICSPLAVCGLTKDAMRQIAREMQFPLPAQKSRPCLLTRFPYGAAVTTEVLVALELAEQAIANELYLSFVQNNTVPEALLSYLGNTLSPTLFIEAIPDFRVRLHPSTAAPLGFAAFLQLSSSVTKEIQENLVDCIAQAGFAVESTTVDSTLSGYFDKL